MEREDVKMLVKKWRDVYNDDSLDFDDSYKELKKKSEAGGVVFDHEAGSKPARRGATAMADGAGAVKYSNTPSAA